MDYNRIYGFLKPSMENYHINKSLPRDYIFGLDKTYDQVVMIDKYFDKLKEHDPDGYKNKYHLSRKDHEDVKFSRIVIFNYKE